MYRAIALVNNFQAYRSGTSSSDEIPIRRLDFGDFSLIEVGQLNFEAMCKEFKSSEVFRGQWVYERSYEELPPSMGGAPTGVGRIPEDTEDTLFLLRLYQIGDVSFSKQRLFKPDGKVLD
jgi:hypothetical protein